MLQFWRKTNLKFHITRFNICGSNQRSRNSKTEIETLFLTCFVINQFVISKLFLGILTVVNISFKKEN
ncbi:hypothetical protein Xen7305DRAFT_00047700 [Xenococcus sp. PCC 7305]|nr:hypothetical protein Xen7305DRAFT_00047700 [Xenococcus sp. PCC 7305]